eukprot:14439034-Alexandrium_andersonii.AAC.1
MWGFRLLLVAALRPPRCGCFAPCRWRAAAAVFGELLAAVSGLRGAVALLTLLLAVVSVS